MSSRKKKQNKTTGYTRTSNIDPLNSTFLSQENKLTPGGNDLAVFPGYSNNDIGDEFTFIFSLPLYNNRVESNTGADDQVTFQNGRCIINPEECILLFHLKKEKKTKCF